MFRSILFEGRMSRMPYFLSVLGLWLILLAAQPMVLGLTDFAESGRILVPLWRGDYEVYGAALDAAIHQQDHQTARYVAFASLFLSLFSAFLILSALRLRDLGRPGRYALISLIPFVGGPALFAVIILLPGDAGRNAYGPGHQACADEKEANAYRPVRTQA